MKRDTIRQVVNLAAIVITLAVNGLANALPLNGQTTGEISDRFDVYFVPAGYVFSIWGVIYIGLLAFAVYQVLPSQRENPRLQRIGYLPALGGLANSLWIFLWHYERFPLTLVAMLALLIALILMYLRLGIGYARFSAAEEWCVAVPTSVYLGWITVATIANVTAILKYANWDGWGISAETWAVIMLAVSTLVASAVSVTRGDIACMLVIVWALAGIAVKHAAVPSVALGAWAATGITVLMFVVGAIFHRRRKMAAAT